MAKSSRRKRQGLLVYNSSLHEVEQQPSRSSAVEGASRLKFKVLSKECMGSCSSFQSSFVDEGISTMIRHGLLDKVSICSSKQMYLTYSVAGKVQEVQKSDLGLCGVFIVKIWRIAEKYYVDML